MSSPSRLSPRYHRIRPSVMAELARSADVLVRAGRPVLNLASGHLPGELPRELRKVAAESWRDGHYSYLGGPGLPSLRDAVVEWLDMRHLRTAEDVLVAPGSRAALASVLAVISGPGDVVLVDGAAWLIFHQLIAVSGATPVPCRPGPGAEARGMKLCAADVKQQLELMPGTRALVLANPVNSTAQIYDAAELAAIVDVCAASGVYCIVDRLYGRLVYDGRSFPYLGHSPAVRDWCVLIDGVARAFRGAGGLRVGWACGPRDVIEAAATAQEHGSGPPGRVVQRVALSALQSPYDIGLLEEMEAARDYLLEQVVQLPGVRPWSVPATMYCLLDLRDWLGAVTPVGWVIDSSGDLADFLLAEANVLLTPSDLAGQTGLVRVSFSQPWEVLADAMHRIGETLGALRRVG
ncbi:MAG: pyridoxal phosphate-dependent aminotransferase [Pseudomonadota bacterium]|nr:pyridoxal phosphate-dependent aminotransferase [Pseudomonadota bacterium]